MSPLRAGVWLAAALTAAKAACLAEPIGWHWLPDLAIASRYDVLFALGAGAAAELAVRAGRRRPRLARLVHRVFLGFGACCVLYAVVAIGVFRYFDRPLTLDLLSLMRGARAARSSITAQLTWPLVVALVAAPLVFLALAIRFAAGKSLPVRALLAMGLWLVAGAGLHAATPERVGRHLEANPHWTLVESFVAPLLYAHHPVLPADFPAEDMLEFGSFGARDAAARSGFEPPPGVPRPKNLILIVLESVGTKYMSLYGSRYDTTPNLVKESAHALVFDNFYAQAPYTYCSFVAINFSIYPNLPWCYAPWAGRPCPQTMASALHERGYRTAYLNNGDLDWEHIRWLVEHNGYETALGYEALRCEPLSSWGTEDRCLIDALVRWIDERPEGPFMAVCWTDQTHDPYVLGPDVEPMDFLQGTEPPALATELARYLNVLCEADRQLGRLFAALRERGLADDTLVAITGDHGEAFRDPHAQRGHGETIYQEDVHVPFFLWNPQLFQTGRREAAIGGHVDLNPTIADVLGVAPSRDWQGHSVFDLDRPPRTFFLTNIDNYLFGVREAGWKYVFEATGNGEWLFDLERDPDERHNLAPEQAARCARLRQRIAAWVSFEGDFLRGLRD